MVCCERRRSSICTASFECESDFTGASTRGGRVHVNFPYISTPNFVPSETACAFVMWSALRRQPTPKGPAMSIDTVVLVVVVFGAAAIVMIISFVLANFEDDARRMVRDKRQSHYGSDVE